MPSGFQAFGSAEGYVGTRPFQPVDVAGCIFWLDASVGVTIVGSGADAWADQSGTGDSNKTAHQTTNSKRPTLNVADGSYNGHDTLSFLGSAAQCMQTGTWAVPVTQPYTLFIVGNIPNRLLTGSYFDGKSGAGRAEIYNDSASHKAYAGAFLSTADTSTAPQVLGYELNGASSKIYISSNTAAVTGNAGTDGISGATIGAAFDQASDPVTGKIAAVIAYSAILSGANFSKVTEYLGLRFGIAIA